jgi:type IV pilus assembly protein PilY1
MIRAAHLIVYGVAVVLIAGASFPAAADDNEIFGAPSARVEPNILIVFDNSGSMRSTAVEDKTRLAVAQETVKNIIDTYGDSNRFGVMIFHDNTDGSDRDSLDDTNGGYFPEYGGRYPVCEVKDTFILDAAGKLKTGEAYEQAVRDYKAYLKSFVDTLTPRTNTPLTETLAEAGLYFAEQASWFNSDAVYYPRGGKYPDSVVDAYNPGCSHPPIEHRCRKNYIILMTDGEPTHDNAAALKGRYINGDFIAGGNLPALDDVAGYLRDNDINASFNTPDYSQNIMVYAIGFQGGDPDLLRHTAERGGGLYFDATSPEDLSRAFITIMFHISERRTLFAAPVVPVSHNSKAYAGEYVYLSLFQPSGEGRWIGNLKKYSLGGDNAFASCGTRTPILDLDGNIMDSARSCWSDVTDGGAVDKGGAGEKLSQRADASRQVYANITSVPDLTMPDNAFSKENDNLEAADFNVADKNALIDLVRMTAESWRLGDLNHSQPAIVSCDSGGEPARYIFAGSNDGMLHCFNDADGQEIWAFVPREQFGRLQELSSRSHPYFMDGSPVAADTSDGRKMIICGERRGGCRYYAIDVSAIDRPRYLYTHTADGQSWKTPQFMHIATGESSRADVFLITGGYDPSVDHDYSAERGRSVYTIDALTGEKKGFCADSSDFGEMGCIVSASGLDMIDDGHFLVSQIYAADLDGHLYAFRDNNNSKDGNALDGDWQKMPLFSVVNGGRKIFEEVDVVPERIPCFNTESGKWERVTGDYVYFGTGDRANPLRTDQADWFYCVKNDWRTGPLTVTAVVSDYPTLDDDPGGDPDGNDDDPVIRDVSDNKIQDGTIAEQQAAREALEKKYNRGWCLALENSGEKCLSTPVVYDGIVYFTTYTPASRTPVVDDPCLSNNPGEGVTRLYALDFRTGAAVCDFGGDDQLGKDDRCKVILDGLLSIAPSPKIFITDRGDKLLIGPHAEDPISELDEVRLFYWKINE